MSAAVTESQVLAMAIRLLGAGASVRRQAYFLPTSGVSGVIRGDVLRGEGRGHPRAGEGLGRPGGEFAGQGRSVRGMTSS